MGIQDVIYWVGVVFVWVVMTWFVYGKLAISMYEYFESYAIKQIAPNASIENVRIESGWMSGIIWSVYTVIYTLAAQWFYHGIWKA